MKIGLLGGTFNPVHYGHLINAQLVKEYFNLNSILFIPSRYPVHKDLAGNISPEHRFNMVKLAISDNPSFNASRIEIDREDESFFIITIRQLLADCPGDDFFLILGVDAFNILNKWKDYEEILRLVSIVVMRRPGFGRINKKLFKKAGKILLIDNPYIEISSSVIREKIRDGRSVKYLLPDEVEEYIVNKGLYKD
ncbi:MAG: nicotinate-nucleotide adenylyltransferase [Spirochaetes bacterium]|nr:nicotinate-nucleotide adenylyltransferase [Spirochaetota bacterium]